MFVGHPQRLPFDRDLDDRRQTLIGFAHSTGHDLATIALFARRKHQIPNADIFDANKTGRRGNQCPASEAARLQRRFDTGNRPTEFLSSLSGRICHLLLGLSKRLLELRHLFQLRRIFRFLRIPQPRKIPDRAADFQCIGKNESPGRLKRLILEILARRGQPQFDPPPPSSDPRHRKRNSLPYCSGRSPSPNYPCSIAPNSFATSFISCSDTADVVDPSRPT